MNDEFNQDRIEARENLLEQTDDQPYPAEVDRDDNLNTIRETYTEPDEFPDTPLTVVGRVTRFNDVGGLLFLDIEDETGSIQLMVLEDEVENFDQFSENAHHTDFVEATGQLTRSNTGELTVQATDVRIVSKALRDPPSDQLSPNNRVRNRVGAMLTHNDPLADNLRTRNQMVRLVRQFFYELDYQEVETPILHSRAGGAEATPFETFVETTETEMYLRIAPELYLKRLLSGGFERVFEVSRVFRNEDADTSHNPEFTMLEAYQAYADYEDMMALTENVVAHVLEEINGSTTIEYDGVELDFSTPWERVEVIEAVEENAPEDVSNMTEEEVIEYTNNVTDERVNSYGDAVMELYEEYVEDSLVQPTFVINHPSDSTPLCKEHRDNPDLLERFEAVVYGMELANAYTELNDPVRQIEAFEEQGGPENVDMDFVEAIAHGMPPAGGLGIGMDRLAMLVTDSQSIKEVLPFPMVAEEN